MKYLLYLYVFLLPFHAVIVTFLSCKLNIGANNVRILRFWKEFTVLILLFIVIIKLLIQNKFKLKKIYSDKPLHKVSTYFILTSIFFIFFPDFNIWIQNLLGFKYDVFFIFMLLVWLNFKTAQNNLEWILKALFTSTGLILIIFLPWYLSWNISTMSEILWYSTEVSNYRADGCISFAQNVSGWYHRFQWSFWDPIRFSVFLVVTYFMFIWYMIHNYLHKKRILIPLVVIPTILVVISIFYSYTKTSLLWFIFWIAIYAGLTYKYKYKKEFSNEIIIAIWWVMSLLVSVFIYLKRDLFLHPDAVLWRVDNLVTSWKMFFWNPIGYGLWIAWPASQLATSNNPILASSAQLFLPENWYVQILLEQWIIWLIFFILILIYIWKYFYHLLKVKPNSLTIWIFTSYLSILFMANFTHIFEESATSYILFLILWSYIVRETKRYKK